MICIMFLRRAADKGKKDLFRALPSGFFPEDTKPYPAGPSTSGTTVVVIIVFQAKVQSYAIDIRILQRISILNYVAANSLNTVRE